MRWLAVVGAAAMLFGAARDAAAFSFSVEPARVELSVPAGKRRGKAIVVNNTKSDHPTHLTIYVKDVLYLPDGTHDFPPPASTEWSCAKWIQVTPTELDVPAGEAAEVRVSVTAPPEAMGGHYAIVFFETTPSYRESAIGVNFRIGALVEVVSPGTEQRSAKLADLSFEPSDTVFTEVFNQGNVLIRPKGKIKVFNADNQRVAQAEFNPNRTGVLPKTLRKFSTTLGAPLSTGAYRVRLELDYGTKQLLVGELPVTIP